MKKIGILIKKEVRDILRDKKTLIMMVVVPMLLYPLIIIGMSLAVSMFMQSQVIEAHIVEYNAQYEEEVNALERLYKEHEDEIDWQLEFQPGQKRIEEGSQPTEERVDTENASANRTGAVRMEMSREADGTLNVLLDYASTDEGANSTRRAVEQVLELYREELLTESLKQAGLDERALYPVVYESRDSATMSESFGMDIGGSIGLMLMVTILLGAVYPSIDATAGEKERGTLETLLTFPVTNFQMIFSKFISVSLFACVTAVLSVLSLGGSVLFLMFGLSDTVAEQFQGISFTAILPYIPLLLITLIATALLATALCMCFCVFAKSFKEANNYITPVLLVVMFASMTAMVPSIQLDYKTAMIPIVNVSLMVKQMISGQLQMSLVGITMVVNFGCSILIAWILAKLYDSEAILFSDGFRSFRIFQKRSDIKKGTVPALGDVTISIVVVLLLTLYVGTVAAVRLGSLNGTAVNQLLIVTVPVLVVWYMKSDVRTLFSLKKPQKGTLIGSVILYLGTYCLLLALSAILMNLMPQSTADLETTFAPIVEAPLPALLAVTALMPAICEETLFRGLLFGSLRERLKCPFWAIVISGFVFGAFHMSLVKLLPTALLGMLFAFLVYRTGSIYPAMALHCLNNLGSMMSLKYPEEAGRILPFLVKPQLSVMEITGLLGVGAVLAALGFLLLRKKKE